jgi:hypothetical protein
VKKSRFVAVLVTALVVAGCGPTIRYVYTPPASPEGRVCTSQCANAQQQCHNQQDAAYQSCQRQHDAAMRNYQACKDAGGKQCQSPPYCSSSSRSDCENPYKQCYTNCGGTIQTIVEKR